MPITVGADPELFLHDGKDHISAIGRLPGTKENPVDIGSGKVHVDNVAGEFNILPASTAHAFEANMLEMLGVMQRLASDHGLILSQDSVGRFTDEEIYHPEALQSGCDPDMNAYTYQENIPPNLYGVPIRAAGGHVHIGHEMTKPEMIKLVRALDLHVTVPMLKYEDAERRRIYGGAGAFRLKPYGVEYRTPSNFWIFNKERREWMFNTVSRVVGTFRDMTTLPEGVDKIINQHDLSAAKGLIESQGLVVCPS